MSGCRADQELTILDDSQEDERPEPPTLESIARLLKDVVVPLLNGMKKAEEESRQEYLSVEQVAAMCGLESKFIRRAMKRGELPHSNVGSEKRATYRISRQDIVAWMQERQVKQGPAKSARQAAVKRWFPGKKAAG
jgi:excisionase family DNA binding protein